MVWSTCSGCGGRQVSRRPLQDQSNSPARDHEPAPIPFLPRGRGSRHGEQMAAPGRQGDEQPLVSQLVAAPLVYPVIEQVGEVPAAAVQVGPAEPDPPIGGLGGEVDHHHVPAAAPARGGPPPREGGAAGSVVGAPRPPAAPPPAPPPPPARPPGPPP